MIPKHAKKVFHGTVFHIYQWEQQMFNQTTKTFEVAQRIDGASIIGTVKDKIVILKQKQPGTKWYYTLPGGYLDHPGETPKAGALRELREETGMKPKSIKLWKSYPRGGRVKSNIYIFIARDCEVVGEQDLDGGEKIEVQLVSFDQFLQFSDDTTFHNRDLIIEMLRARLDKKKKAEFKKAIFGK